MNKIQSIDFDAHAHTHTHTHILTLLSSTHTHTYSLSLSNTHTHTLTLSLKGTNTNTDTHILSLALKSTHAHTHTHTHTHTFYVALMFDRLMRVGSKVMRLENNFGLSVFPVFRTFWTFGHRNKSGTRPLFSNVQKFCKTETEITKIIKNFNLCQKFRYILDIFNKYQNF